MEKRYCVYILSNSRKVLYVGVTSNLQKRLYEHRNKLVDGFTKRYNVTRLVYYEVFHDVRYAIEREKQIKNWKREYKINTINSQNPAWEDLYFQIIQ